MHTKSWLFDGIIILFLVLWSGGFIAEGSFDMWPYFLFPISVLAFLNRNGSLNISDYVFLAVCLVVLFVQRSIYGGSVFIAILPFVALLDCFLLGKVLFRGFARVYVQIMTFFAIVSIFFWVLDLFEPIHDALFAFAKSLPQSSKIDYFWDEFGGTDYEYSLYFYTMKARDFTEYLPRNCGPFFEPGRYVIFLTIAFVLNYYNSNKLFEKKSVLLFLTIITTFSTTGYVAMMFFIFASVLFRSKSNIFIKSVLLVFLLFVGSYIMQLDFMSGKITKEYVESSDNTQSRFGAFLYHMELLKESPLVGYGLHSSKIQMLKSPNGFSALFLYWGFPIAVYMYICLFNCFKVIIGNKDKFFAFIPFVTILLLAFSQTVTTSPLFYCLYGLGSVAFSHNKQRYDVIS